MLFFIPHIPVDLVLRLLMKLARNKSFLYVGRILILSLVTLTAVACASDWGKAFEPGSLPCRIGKYTCYQGEPFGLLDLIYKFGAAEYLLTIPVLSLWSALLLLFKPPRMYLLVFMLNFMSLLVLLFGNAPTVPINYDSGGGDSLINFSIPFAILFCVPLAVAEHANTMGIDISDRVMGEN